MEAVWALGNIAGDSSRCRDYILETGGLPPPLSLFHNDITFSILKNATWTLSNLCRGKNPPPNLQLIAPALTVLSQLIHCQGAEILVDTCWAISYLSDGANERIQAVVESSVCSRLVDLLNHPSSAVQTPALRSVGNIVTGDDSQTQAVINCGAISSLYHILFSPMESIRQEACWAISNITAGSTTQIQQVLDGGLIPPLIHILGSGGFKTKSEVCWAICNATSGGLVVPDQVGFLVSSHCVKPLCDILCLQDNKITLATLAGLNNILRVGELDKVNDPNGFNPYALLVKDSGGLDNIYNLQSHENNEIYQAAFSIIKKYFSQPDEDVTNTGIITGSKGDRFSFQQQTSVPEGGFNF